MFWKERREEQEQRIKSLEWGFKSLEQQFIQSNAEKLILKSRIEELERRSILYKNFQSIRLDTTVLKILNHLGLDIKINEAIPKSFDLTKKEVEKKVRKKKTVVRKRIVE